MRAGGLGLSSIAFSLAVDDARRKGSRQDCSTGFRLARDERGAWVNWPARVAAMMAGELEVDAHKLHTVLERHVREHLGELAEVRPNLR
jgi:hypothetical protein